MLHGIRYRIGLGLIILMAAALSCNLPNETGLFATATASAAEGTLAPGNGGQVQDLSAASLTLADLPPGFEQLNEEEMEELGFGREQIAGNFSGMLSRAQPQNYTAFTKVDPPSYQVVLSTVLAPITTLEKVAVDVYLSNPDQVADNFASETGAQDVTLLPDANRIGSRSVGLSYINPIAPGQMRTDTIIARQDETLQVAIVIYPDGSDPDIRARDVARIISNKISAVSE